MEGPEGGREGREGRGGDPARGVDAEAGGGGGAEGVGAALEGGRGVCGERGGVPAGRAERAELGEDAPQGPDVGRGRRGPAPRDLGRRVRARRGRGAHAVPELRARAGEEDGGRGDAPVGEDALGLERAVEERKRLCELGRELPDAVLGEGAGPPLAPEEPCERAVGAPLRLEEDAVGLGDRGPAREEPGVRERGGRGVLPGELLAARRPEPLRVEGPHRDDGPVLRPHRAEERPRRAPVDERRVPVAVRDELLRHFLLRTEDLH